MGKYLISLPFVEAVETAYRMSLSKKEWEFINPAQKVKFEIRNKLLGIRIPNESLLIGEFTDREKKYLLSKEG
ncbi:MAG: hypothetical protein ACOCRO_11590 [Halanaerobiales bacterium]